MNRTQRRDIMKAASGDASRWLGRPPIGAMNAREIFDEFVNDAASYLDTPLYRITPGLVRIARLERKTVEQVTQEWLAACKERRGNSSMPGTPIGYSTGAK